MSMPTEEPFVVAFKAARPGRAAKQATELMPGALLALIDHASTGTGITAQFARLVTLMTVGCIRFKHQGRSRLHTVDEAY